nr:MAG TPA_asm: hypothetical protein [Caudoviricetes sp.]
MSHEQRPRPISSDQTGKTLDRICSQHNALPLNKNKSPNHLGSLICGLVVSCQSL